MVVGLAGFEPGLCESSSGHTRHISLADGTDQEHDQSRLIKRNTSRPSIWLPTTLGAWWQNTWRFPPKTSLYFHSFYFPSPSQQQKAIAAFHSLQIMEVEGDYFPIIDFPTNPITDDSTPFLLSNASFGSSIPRGSSQKSVTHELFLENSELFYQKLCDLCEFSGRKPM